jgi:hypothetical protein
METVLDAVSVRDLPDFEHYEMSGGISVLKHKQRYAKFFRDACLDHIDLFNEMAQADENVAIIKKRLRDVKREYLAKCDQFCSYLKKRIDRPLSDSDDEYQPNENSYQIPRR